MHTGTFIPPQGGSGTAPPKSVQGEVLHRTHDGHEYRVGDLAEGDCSGKGSDWRKGEIVRPIRNGGRTTGLTLRMSHGHTFDFALFAIRPVKESAVLGDGKVTIEIDVNPFVTAFDSVARAAFLNSKAKGFWDEGERRNKSQMICLMHDELSEMHEAVRMPETPMSEKIPDFRLDEEEAADAIIRIMDYGHGWGLRVAEAVIAKMAYNVTRPPKHGKLF